MHSEGKRLARVSVTSTFEVVFRDPEQTAKGAKRSSVTNTASHAPSADVLQPVRQAATCPHCRVRAVAPGTLAAGDTHGAAGRTETGSAPEEERQEVPGSQPVAVTAGGTGSDLLRVGAGKTGRNVPELPCRDSEHLESGR